MKKEIGLALGGGAVLGAAHIGVLRALEELDYSIKWISGTSIGALIASLYVFEKGYEGVEEAVIDLSWKDVASISISKYALFSHKKMKRFLEETIGDVSFEDANIPFAVVATDIANGKKVILSKGKIAEAVLASTSIPGIFEPVEINKALLVDGGVVENVPVSPLKEVGADFVVGVDLNAKYKYQRPSNIVGVLLNSFHLALSNIASQHVQQADIILEPDTSRFNLIDTKQTKDLIEEGYKEAMLKLRSMKDKESLED